MPPHATATMPLPPCHYPHHATTPPCHHATMPPPHATASCHPPTWLQVAWNTVKEQSHSTDASIEARVCARQRTANAILAVADATRCRMPRATRFALSAAGDALRDALTSTRTRVSELKAKEAELTGQDGGDVANERECVRQGFSEVRSAYRQALISSSIARRAAPQGRFAAVQPALRQGLRSAIRRTRSGLRFS